MSTLKQQWRDVLKDKIQLIQRVSKTDDGKALLSMLETTFQTKMMDSDPYQTAYNVGQYELVEYIKQLNEAKDGNE